MSLYDDKETYATSRSGGLGGTDVSAILGLSPWKRPIEIYAGKVNPGAQPELDKECLFWGSAMEPLVRERYAQRFGVAVTAPADLAAIFPNSRPWRDSTLIVGPEPWMLGAPDGWIPSAKSGLEIKCSSRKGDDWGPEGSDEIPANYFAQASWYAAVCDARGWNFGVLFSGNTLAQYRIERDLAFERDMVEVARSFWFDNIVKRVEPPIDQSESYGKYLARKFSLNTGRVITSPDAELIRWASEMKSADDKVKEATELKTLANNHLRALVGDAQKAITPLGTVGWVRPEEKAVVDWKGFALACNRPDLQPKFESKKQNEAFLRAWWKK